MTAAPQRSGSRAVLIGACRYSHPSLPSIPAAERNVADLVRLLTAANGGFDHRHCVTVIEPDSASSIGEPIGRAAREATDILLVYYAGHGLLDQRGRLYLAVTTSNPQQVGWTSVPFATLREEIAESPAAARILILDCCFSGRAFDVLADEVGLVAGQTDIQGTYTIVSSGANETSLAPSGARHTAFTGALLAAAERLPGGTLDQLYLEAARHLQLNGHPRPRRRSIDTAGALELFGQDRQRPAIPSSTTTADKPIPEPFSSATPVERGSSGHLPDGTDLRATAPQRRIRRRALISAAISVPLIAVGARGDSRHRIEPDPDLIPGSRAAAFSPDGSLVATAVDSPLEGNAIRLWNVRTGQLERRSFIGHTRPMIELVFSPDGLQLASCAADKAVRLWDLANERPSTLLSTHPPDADGMTGYSSLAFSPDGTVLAVAGCHPNIQLWDVARREHSGELPCDPVFCVRSIAFSRDGSVLAATGDNGSVDVWNVADRVNEPLRISPLPGENTDSLRTTAVAFSPDRDVLAVGCSDSGIRLWNVPARQLDGEPLTLLPYWRRWPSPIGALAFSRDGTLLAAGHGGYVHIWDVRHQNHRWTYEDHEGDVSSVGFNADGSLFAVASDEGVWLRRIPTP